MNIFYSLRIMLKTITNSPPNQTDLSIMFRDMRKDRWKRVTKQLKSSRGEALCSLKDPSGLSILSVAVMSNPPLETLLLILKLNPAASLEQDDYGSIPLHLACLNGANADVIRILLEHDNGVSAAVPDDMDRRVPLHHAIEFAARLDKKQLTNEGTDTFGFSDEIGSQGGGGGHGHGQGQVPPGTNGRQPHTMSSSAFSSSSSVGEDALIISLLCDAMPEMVHFRSRSGETPMDIAHVVKELAETPKELERIEKCYSILQNTAIMMYKKNKKQWEDQGFVKVLNPDGMKGETFSLDTSTAESTISSMPTSNLSALASLDPSMSASAHNVAHPHPSSTTHVHGHGHGHVPVPVLQQSHHLTAAAGLLPHELKMHMMGFNIQHLILQKDLSYDHLRYYPEPFQYSKDTANDFIFPAGDGQPMGIPPPPHHHHPSLIHTHYDVPPHAYHSNLVYVHPAHVYQQQQQQQQQIRFETELFHEPLTPEQLQYENEMDKCNDPSLLEDAYSIDDL